ncbi:growth factor receptor-bound protein 7-like [Entelurus aequoreus]|uniref:growth factor receptor-bound protein 7-like n=1 Tax=Entelurus aequoreus TaxID=161455 RepID=UPI002B1E1D70|nr:growth factor receptor-bound protein 7-like [Entelurus aequoreus]
MTGRVEGLSGISAPLPHSSTCQRAGGGRGQASLLPGRRQLLPAPRWRRTSVCRDGCRLIAGVQVCRCAGVSKAPGESLFSPRVVTSLVQVCSWRGKVPRSAAARSPSPSPPTGVTAGLRLKWAESLSSSAPAIPNPFPELCSPSHSPVAMATLTAPSSGRHLLKVLGEDHRGRSLWVGHTTTAREVCHMLVRTAGCSQQENWTLLECHPALGLERCLEDHEAVLEVQASWSLTGDSRLVFCKNYAKYQFFTQPALFFPQHMISDSGHVEKGMTSSKLVQNLLGSGTCPEIQGFLHAKESKSWRKICYFLRPSGLYCSTKGASKQEVEEVCDLHEVQVYKVLKETAEFYAAPSHFCFCLRLSRSAVHLQDYKIMCADSEQSRTCWMSAFRLFKIRKPTEIKIRSLSQG